MLVICLWANSTNFIPSKNRKPYWYLTGIRLVVLLKLNILTGMHPLLLIFPFLFVCDDVLSSLLFSSDSISYSIKKMISVSDQALHTDKIWHSQKQKPKARDATATSWGLFPPFIIVTQTLLTLPSLPLPVSPLLIPFH